MSAQRFSPYGFTVIELILAIAITAILGTCVYSATQAMAATARRQKDSIAQQLRHDRFQEIVRRDLRGWLSAKSGAQSPPAPASPSTSNPANAADIVASAEFDTSADSLTGVLNSGMQTPQRSTHIQYLVRKTGSGFELDRTESTGTSDQSSVVLYQSTVDIKMEFFDGSKWASSWTSTDRPPALRFTFGSESFVVRP